MQASVTQPHVGLLSIELGFRINAFAYLDIYSLYQQHRSLFRMLGSSIFEACLSNAFEICATKGIRA